MPNQPQTMKEHRDLQRTREMVEVHRQTAARHKRNKKLYDIANNTQPLSDFPGPFIDWHKHVVNVFLDIPDIVLVYVLSRHDGEQLAIVRFLEQLGNV